ncbi:hypothetical protein CD178_02078 [Komagataeibacter saccharivorans]|uniref:HEPN domain protein n=1 Tax=Komagataeibacter saccharivorans TaxID=265959 RepID=A0A347WD91_9PROT|nr:hypothetical protein [Komagataeibacter saccharivorans]AXY22834.1 hypothetical protein CD178_02078 [Komagataeibacter saccharivorans]
MSAEAECADQWEALARDELESAQAMLAARKWKNAYQHAGIAVECALKCKIMRVSGMNQWPERAESRDLYTHDLEDLLAICGLEDTINDDLLSDHPSLYAQAWLIIKDWNINMRYHVPGAFPQAMAESAVEAIDVMGLVTWLLQ